MKTDSLFTGFHSNADKNVFFKQNTTERQLISGLLCPVNPIVLSIQTKPAVIEEYL